MSKSARTKRVVREVERENQPVNVLRDRVEPIVPTRPSMARRLSEGPGVKRIEGRGL